jgi:hypothetical protein
MLTRLAAIEDSTGRRSSGEAPTNTPTIAWLSGSLREESLTVRTAMIVEGPLTGVDI